MFPDIFGIFKAEKVMGHPAPSLRYRKVFFSGEKISRRSLFH